MQDECTVGQSRAPVGRCCVAVLAAAIALPAAAQPPDDPLRILGFRRQLAPDAVELVLACSGPVSFSYSSPSLETIRLVLPGVDPAGVTPPREAWGEDLADVELFPAEGDEAPGAVLLLELPQFRPYSIRVVGDELRVELDAPGIGPRPPPPAPVTPIIPEPTPAPTPQPVETPDEARAESPGAIPEVGPDPEDTPVAPALPEPGGAEPAATSPDVSDETAPPDPTPGPVPADPDAPPPPIEPDFFEGPAPEPPAATEPAPATATDPPEPAATEPAPLDDDAPAATRVFEVVRDDRDGMLAIRIPTDGRPSYQAFFTQDGPERLVLDFEGTESRPLFQRLEVGVGPVRRVRVGQHQADPVPIVRVVIDMDERVSHRIETDATGLTLRFDGVPVEP